MFGIKNGCLQTDGFEMEYIRFGTGAKTLILLPGLGDGLQTVRGLAIPMTLLYRVFINEYTVYSFSRRRDLPDGHTTRDMAQDQKQAMDALGIPAADVEGVSMGGMIAQHLAADYPEMVGKLVLVVTSARPNPILIGSVKEWISLAQQGDHTALMESNLRKIYSPEYYRSNRWMLPVVGRLTKRKSYRRFFIQAEACLTHDAFDRLPQIKAPTLVMGGEKDEALGGDASREICGEIPGAQLKMYPQWGHGLYEEEKTFNRTVLEFLRG